MRVIGFVPGCMTCYCVVGDEVAATIWPHNKKPSAAIAVVPQMHHNHAPDWHHDREAKDKPCRAPRGLHKSLTRRKES
jgi:hypothetical protein